MENLSDIRQIFIDGSEIKYVITRKNVKNVNMRIKPDGIVYVSANNSVSISFIENFIKEKSTFIFDAFNGFDNKSDDEDLLHEKQYKDGDIIKLLGEQYTIKIISSDENIAALLGDTLVLFLKKSCKAEEVISKWLNEYTKQLFNKINEEVCEMFYQYKLKKASLQIRNMKSIWGSCHRRKGKIVINSRLICYPLECIKYVFCHEYAHFVAPNHSENFYNVLNDVMSDYKKWSDMLKH